ncbi:MAG: ABC transporter ATP-binding protein [Candidatus Lokiarchaeota archaeon]|nr:ABC transporter ATP-binding protein [Candidatus Lokiarchaeota archaeon]
MQFKEKKVNIECKNVYKIFKQGNLEVVALRNINIKINQGEIVVVMGPSGSGKTTLLNLISGMVEPTAGKIYVDGRDVTKLRDDEIQKHLQKKIGIVFQFFNLVPSLTAKGNIELPLIISDAPTSYRKQRVEELLKEVDIKDRANHRPFSLSGGEKQRVAIASAIANDPLILLADEPTGNIDSIAEKKVMEIFRNYIDLNSEKSLVIVTHNANLRKIADRTLILKDGQIIRELGKQNIDKGKSDGNGISEEAEAMNHVYDEAEKVFNPAFRMQEFKEIKACPLCHSENILKKWDQERGQFQIINNQITTRATIFCKDCHQISFENCAVYDITRDLV